MPRHCFNVGTSSRATISVMPLKVVALVGASFLTRWALWLYRESSKHYITAPIRYLSKFARERDFLHGELCPAKLLPSKAAAMLSVVDRVRGPVQLSFIDVWNSFGCRGDSRRRSVTDEMSNDKVYSILEHLENNVYSRYTRIICKRDAYQHRYHFCHLRCGAYESGSHRDVSKKSVLSLGFLSRAGCL